MVLLESPAHHGSWWTYHFRRGVLTAERRCAIPGRITGTAVLLARYFTLSSAGHLVEDIENRRQKDGVDLRDLYPICRKGTVIAYDQRFPVHSSSLEPIKTVSAPVKQKGPWHAHRKAR